MAALESAISLDLLTPGARLGSYGAGKVALQGMSYSECWKRSTPAQKQIASHPKSYQLVDSKIIDTAVELSSL